MQISLSQIYASPHPVRTTWDDEKLNELAQSLKEQGLIQPVKVRPIAGGYEVVYGHRRVEAARRAEFTNIEAIVETIDDQQTLIQALIENVQREDMTPPDTARGLKALIDITGWSQGEIERKGIMHQTRAGQLLLLLNEPIEIMQMLEGQDPVLTEKHIRQVRQTMTDPVLKVAVLQKASQENLSSAQTRRVAESVASAPGEHAKQVLLNRPYSEYTHDPELIKERADKFGAHDPLYANMEKSHLNDDWKTTPEVSNVIALMRSWMGSLTEFRKADELGKMSPEAKGFVARRVRQFAEALIEWANKLEGQENG